MSYIDQVHHEIEDRNRVRVEATVASTDPAFLHAFWLLTQIPLAARGPTFAEEINNLMR